MCFDQTTFATLKNQCHSSWKWTPHSSEHRQLQILFWNYHISVLTLEVVSPCPPWKLYPSWNLPKNPNLRSTPSFQIHENQLHPHHYPRPTQAHPQLLHSLHQREKVGYGGWWSPLAVSLTLWSPLQIHFEKEEKLGQPLVLKQRIWP